MSTIATFGNNWVGFGSGGTIVGAPAAPAPTIPPYTLRFEFSGPFDPTTETPWKTGATWTQVSSSPNVWDYTRQDVDWSYEFQDHFGTMPTGQTMAVTAGDISDVERLVFAFSELGNLTGFNLTVTDNMSVVELDGMFSNCLSLTNVTPFSLGSAEYTTAMFSGCESLQSIGAFDTSAVIDMVSMFEGCVSLTSIAALDMSACQNASFLFSECHSLQTLPTLDTSSVEDFSGMFASCLALQTAPALDTSSGTTFSVMFADCSALTSVPLLDTGLAENVEGMFANCVNVASGALDLYTQMSTQATPPQYHNLAFHQCGSQSVSGAQELAQIPTSWK